MESIVWNKILSFNGKVLDAMEFWKVAKVQTNFQNGTIVDGRFTKTMTFNLTKHGGTILAMIQ